MLNACLWYSKNGIIKTLLEIIYKINTWLQKKQ